MTDPRTLIFVRLSLRFLQFASSLVVVVALSYAFKAADADTSSRNDVTFAALMGFLGLIYGLFYLVFIEILMLCMRPLLFCEQAMDFTMALLLLIASIVLTTSRTVRDCRTHQSDKPHCDAAITGTVFCYVSTAAFVSTLVLGCCANRDQDGYDRALFGEDSPISIEYDPTPVGVESPSLRYASPGTVKV